MKFINLTGRSIKDSMLFGVVSIFLVLGVQTQSWAAEKVPTNPAPTPKDWSDLAGLPDWSGTWNPKVTDQDLQVKTNPPPWN